eukprot:5314504-Amphidinium_carterae.1
MMPTTEYKLPDSWTCQWRDPKKRTLTKTANGVVHVQCRGGQAITCRTRQDATSDMGSKTNCIQDPSRLPKMNTLSPTSCQDPQPKHASSRNICGKFV